MAFPVTSDSIKYFLGKEGEQIGPLTQEDILQRIQSGGLSPQTLIWCEGMPKWLPLAKVPTFAAAFFEDEDTLPMIRAPKAKTPKVTFEPVFSESESRFNDGTFVSDRILHITFGVFVLLIGSVAYFYFEAQNSKTAPAKRIKTISRTNSEARKESLARAQNLILTNPGAGLTALQALLQQNSSDAVSKEALKSLLEYFRSKQMFREAAEILATQKQYFDAAKFLAQDPKLLVETEAAYFRAFQGESDSVIKRAALLESVKLLLGPLGKRELGMERIALFEKAFPGENHPYHYYLQPADVRIAEVFPKIAFHYVNSLLQYMDTELSQLKLSGRPLIEIKKSPSGEYRIVGSYRGKVQLNRESLNNVFFVFWQEKESWVLVDTNLTKERRIWAEKERARLRNASLKPEVLLVQLENVFTQEFPKQPLHEKVPH